jgi:hypothetical protein
VQYILTSCRRITCRGYLLKENVKMGKIVKEEVIKQLNDVENPRSVVLFSANGDRHTVYFNCENRDFAYMLVTLFEIDPKLVQVAEKSIVLYYERLKEKT